jgi:sugar lactone lactonase YvrE
MAIDAQDNIWICDENGDTVMKLSPEGKLLMTLGVKGQRGDWDEAKGQRLLWQPLHLAFAPNGDIYIGMGHANESPNDTDKSPANSSGAARVLHLDKNGKFINQWFGNNAGQGHFSMVHGIAVNPSNGNVYIGDREEYRIVVYDGNGRFIKTIQMRNLVCALYVDPHKQLWIATGQDGQIFKIDWDGNVLGAIGNGPGRGEGQFTESNYMAMDSHGNLFTGDTGAGRISEMVAPKN